MAQQAQQQEEKLRIIPLGGVDEFGKNITVVEYGEDMLVVDCGSIFPKEDMLGVDLVIPDVTYLIQNKDRIRGMLLTHGHEDHIGATPYVLRQVPMPLYGTKLTLALVNDPSLIGLISQMGIDAYVNPRATTVSSILRYVRHGRVRAVYSVGNGEAELIESQVLRTTPIAGRLVREAELPDAAIIGLIRRGDRIIVPRGDTRITEGDVLTIFAMSDSVAEVEQLFQVGIDFF